MQPSRRQLIQAACAASVLTVANGIRAQEDILSAEDAFRLRVRRAGARVIELMWIAAPGTYLYKDRLSVRTDHPQVEITQVDLPPAQTKYDRALEKTVAYYEGSVLMRVAYAGPAVPFRLLASAQGCAEAVGLCYPPVTRELAISGVPA